MQIMLAAIKLELGDTLYYLLIFAALLWLVNHFAFGPVSSMMEKRRKKVISDLDDAENKQKKAELLANQREAELKNSKQEATLINMLVLNSLKISGCLVIPSIVFEITRPLPQHAANAVRPATSAAANCFIKKPPKNYSSMTFLLI